MRSAPKLDARALAALYDEGYYHGVGSGYPAAGYEREHASWQHWVRHLAATYAAGARWLDLGCAYGYLVAEACDGGFRAAGIDVSRYALGRAAVAAPTAHGRVAHGVAEALPFADATFDVVSAFDVLEHLLDPEPVLREAHRVLRPGGVLIGATPDPLVFDRDEETHFSERPPSYWIDRLLALGFAVDFRFFQEPYNLELAAIREPRARLCPAARLHVDGFGAGDELGAVAGPTADRVAVRLRAGWGGAADVAPAPARWVAAGDASAYVLVAGRGPLRLSAALELGRAEGTARVRLSLDDHQLGEVVVGTDWRRVELPAVPVAAGGHHLRLTTSAALFVRTLDVYAQPATRDELVARLPFDMFQRYDQCRAVVARLGETPTRVLDVGGVLGGAGGHLATTNDFVPAAAVVTTDVRGSDHPDHVRVAGGELPFADASFDLVVSMDVLEHVPAAERLAFHRELARVARRWVLLAAPFATAGVRDADALLYALIEARHRYQHRFLSEHLTHGHPDLDATVAWWRETGASVVVLPNGYLPYWSLMQALNLRLAEPTMGDRYTRGQALYNTSVHDWREPAYRHLLVIDRSSATDWRDRVTALTTDVPRHDAADAAALSAVLDVAGLAEMPARAIDSGASVHSAPRALTGASRDDVLRTPTAQASAAPGVGNAPPLSDAQAFAERVWSHPLYRAYAAVRRALGGGRPIA